MSMLIAIALVPFTARDSGHLGEPSYPAENSLAIHGWVIARQHQTKSRQGRKEPSHSRVRLSSLRDWTALLNASPSAKSAGLFSGNSPFSHTACKTRFLSSDSASICFSSRFSRSNSLSRRASLRFICPNCRFHRWKLTSRDVLLPTQFLDALLPTIRFPQNPNLVFGRIPLAFHVWCLSFAPKTNTSHGPKKRGHVSSNHSEEGSLAIAGLLIFITLRM